MRFTPKQRGLLGRHTMRLQLIAMIDVVLFILLYFMLSSSFAADEKTLGAALGVEGRGGRGTSLQPQVVQVEVRDGATAYVMGQRVVRDRAQLEAILRQLPTEQGVFIKVSGGVSVEAAATAMQAATNAGFRKISYVAAGG
jgi:biopolymer transport protein ExbD